MNPAVMPALVPLRFAALLLAAALVAGCGENSGPAEEPPLAGAAIGGPFELVDAAGEQVRWSDFDGRWRMVYFGYAYCPDVCPFDVQRMMQGYRQFASAEPELATDLQPLFITIDPERDTPQVIGEFTAAFGDALIGLTGTPAQIDAAARAFSVYYGKVEGSEEGGGYLMDHSRAAYLMNRNGEPVALLPVEQSGEAVAAELIKWVS